MVTIENVLSTKGHDVIFVSPDFTVFHALKLMAEKDIGAVLILDNGKVVGLFSERDYARKVVLKGRSSRDMEIREAMTSPVFYIDQHRTIEDCMVLMTEKKLRYVPVIENNELLGILSVGDIVNEIIKEQKHTIEDLENYIIGSYGTTTAI